MEIRPRKKVSTACSHCKLRKRKCSATLPCNNCVVNHQKCVYGDSMDGRRKESIQRARLESNFHREVLDRLLDRIRSGEDDEVRSLVASEASMEEIATHLHVPSLYMPDNASSSTSFEPRADPDQRDDQESSEGGMQHPPLCLRNSYARPGYIEVFGNLPFSSAIPSAGYDAEHQQHQVLNFRIPEYAILPLHWPDSEGSLTRLLRQLQDSSRRELAAGNPPAIVLGPEVVDLEVVLRGFRTDDLWTPTTWACQIQRSYERLDKSVRLATVYFCATYTRWLIAPTAQHYALMPECMRPTIAQRLIPHHGAVDMAYHPAIRDIMILENHESGPACEERPDIVLAQVFGLMPDWNIDIRDAITIDPATGNRTLSRPFIDIISQVETWRTGRGFLKAMPRMAGKMVFAQDESIPVDDRQLHDIDWG